MPDTKHPCSEETRQKVSQTLKGYIRSPLHCRNISIAKTGQKPSLQARINMSKGQMGRKHSEETKKKIGDANRGSKSPMYGKHLSDETKLKLSKAKKGKPKSEEHKDKISKALKGRIFSKDHRENLGRAFRANWQDPSFRKRTLKIIMEPSLLKRRIRNSHISGSSKPTKPERQLRKLLKKLFPGEYKYVGNGKIIIGGKCPDFININGQKKIIEVFGDYWHSKSVTGKRKKQHRKERQAHFAEYGYKTLVIWEHQLSNKPKMIEKLKAFHGTYHE